MLAPTGVALERHATLEAATRWCFGQAQPGDAVLLSPACASLDMFRNYAHRAEVFVAEVQAIAPSEASVALSRTASNTMSAHATCRSGSAALASAAWRRGARLRSRADAEAIPVRDWISVVGGQPARLLGFDRALVWVVIALLALGLVMVYSAPRSRCRTTRSSRATRRPTS